MKSLLRESVSLDEDIRMDCDYEPELCHLQEQLEDMSEEIEGCYLEESSVEVATVISGYIAKKVFSRNSCSKCKALMTLDDSTAARLHPGNEHLLILSPRWPPNTKNWFGPACCQIIRHSRAHIQANSRGQATRTKSR